MTVHSAEVSLSLGRPVDRKCQLKDALRAVLQLTDSSTAEESIRVKSLAWDALGDPGRPAGLNPPALVAP